MTSQLTAYLAELPSRAIPDPVWDEIGLSFADTVAAMLAGVQFDATRVVATHPLHMTSGPISSTLLGIGGRRSLLDAALIQGVMAHVADFDDVSWALMGHPSATLVPALLPLGEHLGTTGEQLATAYLAGYEVAVELGHATAPAHYLRGWHATATIGSIAVAAACATLLGLDPDRARNALGIAASSSSGLRQNFGSGVKSLHAGFAARNGVEAAMLARDGYTANADALDGRWGFFRAFDDREDGALRDGAFTGFSILAPGTLRKRYPSCGATHQAIDAARAIADERSAGEDAIKSVEVSVAPACFAPLLAELPTTPLEAKFSMQYCVTTALLEGDLRARHFSTGHLVDPSVQALMSLVTMVPNADLAGIPENSNAASAARVTVDYREGDRRSVEVRFPSGAPENPLTQEELRTKFLDCAEHVLPVESAEQAFDRLLALRVQPTVDDIPALLVP